MAALLVGPLIILMGVGAVFFVLRRKRVEKRSMYSARRQQIEHKVRSARQRTLAPHGHAPKPAAEPAPAATGASASPFDQKGMQPTVTYQYQAPAYEAPPVAPPPAPPGRQQEAPSGPMPWDVPSSPAPTQAPASTGWDFPPATAAPAEPAYAPPEPTPSTPTEPVWTPAPVPAEPLAPARTAVPAASTTAAGSWEIVSTTKESAATIPQETKKKKKGDKAAAATGSSWELASGDAPGAETEEAEIRRPAGPIVAVVQYVLLVLGLVMVLIGVLVMVANVHVTP